MRLDRMKPYLLEAGALGVALIALVVTVAMPGAGGLSQVAGALVPLGVALVTLGVCLGALARRALDRAVTRAREERLSELELRPTCEAYESLRAQADAAARDLSSAEAALAAADTERDRAEQAVRALEGALAQARTTASLDRFSDFQLLGMCDVLDAEEQRGYLRRAYGDPAMEQLLALDIVSFDAAQDSSKELMWTLRPEWRQAVRAQRPAIERRIEALRLRRELEAPSTGPARA